jgi:hypothetical protein
LARQSYPDVRMSIADLSMPPNHANPTLPPGYPGVPPGHVAAVVTSLEMLSHPPLRPARPFPAGFELQPLDRSSTENYRTLFRAVGTDWLWFSRLIMPEEKLRAILDNIFVLRRDESGVGILELDSREPEVCELAFFGLAPDIVGQGVGRTRSSSNSTLQTLRTS